MINGDYLIYRCSAPGYSPPVEIGTASLRRELNELREHIAVLESRTSPEKQATPRQNAWYYTFLSGTTLAHLRAKSHELRARYGELWSPVLVASMTKDVLDALIAGCLHLPLVRRCEYGVTSESQALPGEYGRIEGWRIVLT
jgi:hypothetical protein